MFSARKLALFLVAISGWRTVSSASLSILQLSRTSLNFNEEGNVEAKLPAILMRAKVREGVPPPLCPGLCGFPPKGPVCAFDAKGRARTFATLCELEAVSCRESTYYAIASLGSSC